MRPFTGHVRLDGKDGKELSDWIHPVVIKDLRQSLRSNLFVGTFLAAQFGMALFTLLPLRETDLVALSIYNGAFWIFLCIALLFASFRGFFTIGRERKECMLEQILMTPAGEKVVLAKWSALMIQNIHFCSSLLPYFIVRYLLGGRNLFEDILGLLSMVCVSGALLIMAISLSSSTTLVKKVSVALIFLFGYFTFLAVADRLISNPLITTFLVGFFMLFITVIQTQRELRPSSNDPLLSKNE